MMRSLFAGVSGLSSHQTRMDVIGNNIANVNTIGFKKSRVTFQDMLSQTIGTATAPSASRGGVNPMQVGLGVQLGTIDVIHTEGSTEPTGVQTDLSIRGNGFFVLLDGQQQLFTRAGAFDLDEAGWLESKATGIRVAGWNAVDGNINTNQPLEQIRIPVGQTLPARATTEAVLEGNLDATVGTEIGHIADRTVFFEDSANNIHQIQLRFEKVGQREWAWIALDENGDALELDGFGTPDAGDIITWPQIEFDNLGQVAGSSEIRNVLVSVGGVNEVAIDAATEFEDLMAQTIPANPRVTTTVKVVDSQGVLHRVIVDFEKTAPNYWTWSVEGDDNPLGTTGSGLLEFGSDGTLRDFTNATITVPGIAGADQIQLDLDFERMSQYGAESAVATRSQNGFSSGTLEEVRIDATGVLTGVFSNGLTRALAQVGMATFSNNGGLLRAGETMFEESRNSGLAQIGAAGTADRGLVTPGTLEMSNVDLSEEFTSMIITQRGFQANSRVITTSDEMLQELVNLKR